MANSSTLDYLLEICRRRGAGFLTLLDPDRLSAEELEQRATVCAVADADAILVGTSLMLSDHATVFKRIKGAVDIPVIIFPGSVGQIVPAADAILFLSLISGRNPELLVGQHVKAAPLLKEYGIEAIPTGYILVESGAFTSVEFMSNTRPIPRSKNDIAMAHALAAEYLGMRLVYLEAGSGANDPVPDEMVQAVVEYISLPVIVGGGIRDPDAASSKINMGASFVVTGTTVENDPGRLREIGSAVHSRG